MSLSLLPLYCISLSPSLSLPSVMAPCWGAPSGCVWDGVVGWHLAAPDKKACELVLFLLRFFFFGHPGSFFIVSQGYFVYIYGHLSRKCFLVLSLFYLCEDFLTCTYFQTCTEWFIIILETCLDLFHVFQFSIMLLRVHIRPVHNLFAWAFLLTAEYCGLKWGWLEQSVQAGEPKKITWMNWMKALLLL